jgi:hypothetical protein
MLQGSDRRRYDLASNTESHAMNRTWNTKYGPRQVKEAPPTLDEAIFAATGITDDVQAQAEIAAELMGLPLEEVKTAVRKSARTTLVSAQVTTGGRSMQRSVVVERVGRRPMNLKYQRGR